MKTAKLVTAEDIRNVEYRPETGEFFRYHLHFKRVVPINPAPTSKGYLRAKIGKRCLFLHIVAYVKMTGEMPIEIDHINGDKSDNRWENLRNANRNINCINRKGVTYGVTYHQNRKSPWRTKIRVSGENTNLGSYPTKVEGQLVYLEALNILTNTGVDAMKSFAASKIAEQKVRRKAEKSVFMKNYWKCQKEKRRIANKQDSATWFERTNEYRKNEQKLGQA